MSDVAPLVPPGAAYYPVQGFGSTQSYAFILVPGFTLLAFSSAVEPLRIANQLSQKPLYGWSILSETGEPVVCSAGIPMGTEGMIEAPHKHTRLFICAGNPPLAATTPAIVGAVTRHHRFGGTVGGICTGGFALAKAGLVSDRRFTVHWENHPGLIETFPGCVPSGNRYEIDGRIMTCGGGAASTDMMLSIIASDHGGDFAAMVSEMCLRPLMPGVDQHQRSSLAALMSSRNPVLIATVTLMNRHLDDPLQMDELAEAAGYSRRHLERLFRDATGQTPGDFYRGLRLDRGRNLLTTTELSLQEIAMACGYGSVSHFSKSFKSRYGTAPTKLAQGL